MQNTWLENRIHKWHYDHLEGGGGVERFTTAKVTIYNELDNSFTLYGAFYTDYGPTGGAATYGNEYIGANVQDVERNIILCDGVACITADITASSFYVSGNISYNSTHRVLVVTGDCSISLLR